MKLYLMPGVCSLSPHIVLSELGLKFDAVPIDRKNKQTPTGQDYKTINPKGSVPALELDNGEVLTEGAAIVQYLADQKPEAKLAPAAGTMERYRLQEWLNYIASEVHKSYAPLFNPHAPEEWKKTLRELLGKKFDYLNSKLEGKKYLMGDTFTVADAYLFTVLRWTPRVEMDLAKWTTLHAYFERVGARPAVQTAMKEEGLTN